MSYSDFNNAYQNMNHKLLETFDGITDEDLNYSKDDIPINYNNNIKQDLNGTTLNNLNNNKLTHRECINLYLNPNNLKNPKIEVVLKHLSNCSLCQNEIKKINESLELLDQDNQQHNISNLSILNNNNIKHKDNILSQITKVNQSNSVVEAEIETENKVVNISINQLEILLKNIINQEKKNDEYDNFNRILKSLEKKTETKPLSIEINFVNIIICLLIILLIIDIIIRIKN
jgi:hypothetical protein